MGLAGRVEEVARAVLFLASLLAKPRDGCDRISLPRNPQGRKIATNNFGIREMSD
jgi:hypothetical protein